MLRAKLGKRSATVLLAVMAAPWCALSCAADDATTEPNRPAINRMFIGADASGVSGWIEDPIAYVMAGGRVFFDDTSCWIPDADSFDDYEDVNLGIPRGTTPVSLSCAADGIETGPLQFEASGDPMDLLPSRWCPSMRADCMPVESAGPSEGGGY
jgi:hypothetical protein